MTAQMGQSVDANGQSTIRKNCKSQDAPPCNPVVSVAASGSFSFASLPSGGKSAGQQRVSPRGLAGFAKDRRASVKSIGLVVVRSSKAMYI